MAIALSYKALISCCSLVIVGSLSVLLPLLALLRWCKYYATGDFMQPFFA